MLDSAVPEAVKAVTLAVNTGCYPTPTEKAQPWKEWMKLVEPTAEGDEMVVSIQHCPDIVSNNLGGY